MKKVWKWILLILLVLVIVTALVALALMFRNYVGWHIVSRDLPGREWHTPMMQYRTFTPFGGGLMLFGLGMLRLIPWVLLGLVIYGAYRFGVKRATAANDLPPVAPAPVRTCPKCGQVVQDGWNNCANCGKKL